MYKMFQNCISLISIDMNNIDTSLVIGIREIFSGCISLQYLDLTNFNTEL